MEDNKLTITIEDGTNVTINVLDIIESNVFNKTFIIYTFVGEDKTIFASILNETETTYSLDTITNEEEIDYINSEIDRVSKELDYDTNE